MNAACLVDLRDVPLSILSRGRSYSWQNVVPLFLCFMLEQDYSEQTSLLQILFDSPEYSNISIRMQQTRPKSAITVTRKIQSSRPSSSTYRKQQVIFPAQPVDAPFHSYITSQASFDQFNQANYSKAIDRYKRRVHSTTKGLFYTTEDKGWKGKAYSFGSWQSRATPKLKPSRLLDKRSIKQLKRSLEAIRFENNHIESFIVSVTQNSRLQKNYASKANIKSLGTGPKLFRNIENIIERKEIDGSKHKRKLISDNKKIFSITGSKYVENFEGSVSKSHINHEN